MPSRSRLIISATAIRDEHFSDRLLAVLLIAAAAASLLAWSRLAGFRRHEVVLQNARGMPLRAVVFEPAAEAGAAHPAVVVCQPTNSPPEAGQALILEFVRRGMLAVTFDFRGAAPGENRALLREDVLAVTALDVAAVLDYLARRADVDRARIGLIGHSVGGTLAIRAGVEQPWVRATVAVGIAGDVTRNLPQNLLWLVGLYDEFRPLSEMLEVMEASNAEGLAELERTTGDFARGTARRLAVTGTADHFTEFVNHGTAVRAVEWFESAFGGRPAPRPRLAVAPWFYACYSLAFLSGWLLLLRRLRSSAGTRSGVPWVLPAAGRSAGILPAAGLLGRLRGRVASRRFSLGMAALIVALILAPLPRLALFRADLALWGLALLLAVNADVRPGRAVWLLPLGWASVVITLVVNQVAYFWRYPHLLAALPAFPFWYATGLLNQYLFIYPRGLLFSSYTGAVLHPGWLLWSLLALEVARPGAVLRGLRRVAPSVAARSAKPTPAEAGTGRRKWLAWAAVLGLFGILAAVLSMRAEQGFVNRQSLGLAAWVILRFAVLPFFVFALLRRVAARHWPATQAGGL